jgi:streptogramin lyase
MRKIGTSRTKRSVVWLTIFSLILSILAIYPNQVEANEITAKESVSDDGKAADNTDTNILNEILYPRQPRAVGAIKVYVDGTVLPAQGYEMFGEKVADVEIAFSDTLIATELVTISLSNGALLRVSDATDIQYIDNNIPKPITDLDVSEDSSSMTFKIGTAARFKSQKIRFQIEAPSTVDGVTDFELFAKVGTGLGSKTSTINLISGLTIEAPDVINNVDEFMIEGNALYQGGPAPDPSVVIVEIYNKETGMLVDEIQYLATITEDGRYSAGPIMMPDTYEEGAYIISICLLHDDIYPLDFTEKEIHFTNMPPVELKSIKMQPDDEIFADKREITIRGFQQDNSAAHNWQMDLSVSGDAELSQDKVKTDSTGKALVTIANSTDEYVILTAKSSNGVTATIPVDFRSIPNLAFNQVVTVSDVLDEDSNEFGLEQLNDGFNDSRWSSGNGTESWTEIEFVKEREINTVTIKGFTDTSGRGAIDRYKIEYFDGAEWKKAYETSNESVNIEARFPTIKAEKLRISLTGNSSSICELGIFKALDYVLTIRDRIQQFDSLGNKIAESESIRPFTYDSGEAITSVSPLSGAFDTITVSIPSAYQTNFTAANNVVTGTMPAEDVEIEYVYTSTKTEIKKINVQFEGGELKLSDSPELNYIWVANSSKGTVVLIDTKTQKPVAEYKTAPDGQPKNPSRTTTDKDGNVWVTNRDGNSVIKIGLEANGGWIDKNGNGVCDTSTGLGDIRAWTNANGADTAGGVNTAADECILEYIKVSSSGTRHLSVDEDNNVWVSGTGNRKFDLIQNVRNSKLGIEKAKIIRTEQSVGYGGYGGLITYVNGKGVIWSSNPLLRWEVDKPLSGSNGGNWIGYNVAGSYGLGVDSKGNVWNSTLGGNGHIYKYNPSGALIASYPQGASGAQGVAIDKNDHVWVAHSLYSNTIGHLDNNGRYIETITVTSGANTGPTGIAISEDNKIWVTCYNGMVKVYQLGAAPDYKATLEKTIQLDGNLYNYSDMTGSTLVGTVYNGTHIIETEFNNIVWNSLTWEGENAFGELVDVSISASEDGISYVGPIDAKDPLGFSLKGKKVRIVIKLTRGLDGKSPVVRNMVLSSAPY